MNYEERALLEKQRKKQSIKTMYFNRYLLVRYVTALFFFTNLYWFISLVLSDSKLYFIPFVLLLFIVASVVEQVKIYSSPSHHAKFTKYSFMALLATNVICIAPTCFSSTFALIYPFLINQEESRVFILTILISGILLSAFILKRLHKISLNEDKHYGRIKLYEKVIN